MNGTRPLTIAIAEDDELQRDALEQALKAEGFEVLSLEDGFELADYFSSPLKHWADAIVADVNMPGRSGLDGLELARRRGLEVPIFVVSGEHSATVRERVARLGNALFVAKPLDAGHLAAAIRELSAAHAQANDAGEEPPAGAP